MHKWHISIMLRNHGDIIHGYYTGPEATPEEVFRKKIANNEFATWLTFDGRYGEPVYVKNSELSVIDIFEEDA